MRSRSAALDADREYAFAAVTAAIDWQVFPLTEQQSEMLRGSKIITPDKEVKVIG